MKTILTVAAGLLGAGVASAAPTLNGNDSDVPSLAQPEAELAMHQESQLLSSISTLYADNHKEVTWGGRLMNDIGFFDADMGYPDAGADGIEFRRARFHSTVKLYDQVEGKVEFDFAGGDADFRNVYIRMNSPVGKLTIGSHKQPFGLEELTSSRHITFMERSAINSVVAPGYDNGVSTGGNLGDDTRWALGVFRRTDNAGVGTGGGEFATTGRVTHGIVDDDSVVHLGLSLSMQAGMDVGFDTDPEAHLLGDVLDTGTMPSDGSLLSSLELAWVNGPFSAQGEYMMAGIDEFGGAGAPDVDLEGFYAFVSWFLTGESRPYKSGKFDRVKPAENWDGEGFGGGAWEVALRFSNADFTDLAASNDELTNVTLGANWYLNPNARIMFNIISSNYEMGAVDEDLTAFMMRFQFDW